LRGGLWAPLTTTDLQCGARIRIVGRNLPLPFKIVTVQAVAATVLALMFLLSGGRHATASGLAGMVALLPGAWFAWRVVAEDGRERSAVDTARRLLGSGIAKLLFTVGLLVVTFVWFRPEPVAFFATLVALQAVYWFVPLLDRR
jgi:F0F1-type ATP synthase assembly protein I